MKKITYIFNTIIFISFFSNIKANAQCSSYGNTSYNTGVTFVSFNTISNADIPKNVGYENFTGISTNVTQGNSHNLTVRVNTDGNYTIHAFAWIDWNQDGDFLDSGESYDLGDVRNVSDGTTSLCPLTITIPLTAATGTTRMRVSAKYNSNPSSCETNFDGEVEDYSLNILALSAPEINIQGNSINITDGDLTPTLTDFTDFGNVAIATNFSRTFTIQNLGTVNLNLTAAAPHIVISGANAADFSVTTIPSTPIAASSSTTFVIRFAPTTPGIKNATITIANNDSNENPYDFSISGTAYTPAPEINIQGNTINIADGDITPTTTDHTDFGNVAIASNFSRTFTIQNLGTANLNLTGALPRIAISGANASDFSVTTIPSTPITASGSTTFVIRFAPTTIGIKNATLTIANDDSNENPYDFSIRGNAVPPFPEIEITGNALVIADGDVTPTLIDNSDFGNVNVVGSTISKTYIINNVGTGSLNLTGASPYISISGPHASDFTVSVTPTTPIAAGGQTTFTISFDPNGSGLRSATISIANDDTDENPYDFSIQGTGVNGPPQYTAYYESFDVTNGGWSPVTSTNDTWVWTNTYPASVTDEIAEGGFWRNNTYNNYVNNTDIVIESPVYNFTNLRNLRLSLDVEYNTQNNSDGMRILYSVSGGPFTILGASGSGTNWYDDNTTALGSDGWNDDSHTTATTFPGPYSHFKNAILDLPDGTFSNQSNVRFRIQFATDGSTTEVGVGFDNFRIEADPLTTLSNASVAPANVKGNLRLWLKANTGIAVSDGARLTGWEDQAYATVLDKEDATAASYIAPTYRDNNTRNINYNPIAVFNISNTEYMNGKGGFYSQDYFVVVKSDDVVSKSTGTTTRQFPFGGRSDNANFHEDPTGIAFGSSTGRYVDEVVAHNLGAYANSGFTPGVNSYGRAYTSTSDSYNHVLIINAKANFARTAQEIYKNGKRIDNTTGTTGTTGTGTPLNYYEFNNLSFLVGAGRSGFNGRSSSQLNGMLGEVISYNSPNSILDKQKIQSYLGIKYGVTLQADASSLTNYRVNDVNYIDSQGNIIWNTSSNSSYNYDIAGIGRDDASQLNQKQSKSQNLETDIIGPTSGFLTMGLTSVYNTNKLNIATNPTNFTDRAFLCWGNNGVDINLAAVSVGVDMSAGIAGLTTPVSFVAMQRVWKVVETGGDVPSVQVKIPQSCVRNINPPGSYLMFISNSGVFDPTADYRVMTSDGNGNLVANYDFDGVKYITFGYAPQVIVERSVYFDGVQDYIDMENNLNLNPAQFTISAWIKRDTGTTNASILSKRNATYTEGYDFKLNATGRLEFVVNGGAASVTSSVVIPANKWHEVAVIYTGGIATLYIDGAPDTSAALPAPVATTQSFYIAAAGKNTPTAFFKGNIDEVRIWNRALTVNQLRYIMNQELVDKNITTGLNPLPLMKGFVLPTTITKNELNTIPWSDLAGYYPLSVYTYTNTNDMSGNNRQGALRNLDTVDFQTAPLPYVSQANGAWSTPGTWLNNAVQELPNALSILPSATPITWNIVTLNNNITIDDFTTLGRERAVQGLIQNSGDLQVNGNTATNTGNGLTVTHYLKLNGTIDLEGESQLIQSQGSDLDPASTGTLERDQQGYSNTYLYNYWSSPVAPTINSSYSVPQVITNVGFLTSGFNGTTAPAVADYWIWKYANRPGDTYSQWQHARSTGSILPAEGFTMKGPGTVTPDQNYIFNGKPNNGTFSLTIGAGNDYLVGNPYPSAMDADEFIKDNISNLETNGRNTNGNIINGALYFWDHFAVNSHNLGAYQGGYATYTLIGGTKAISNDARINASGVVGTKIPERYIPVAQGFFVSAISDGALTGLSQPIAGGDILFKNSQRIFKKEQVTGTNTGSLFFKSAKSKSSQIAQDDADTRQKIRLMFDSPNGYHRQLLVGVDAATSNNFDLGYDALLNETNNEDMYWHFSDSKFIIQAVNNFSSEQVLPLGITISKTGLATIRIDSLENIDANANIFVHDKQLNTYHNLKDGNYQVYVTPGTYTERFEITFANAQALNTEGAENSGLQAYFSNEKESIIVHNPHAMQLKSVVVLNILGQSVLKFESNTHDTYITHKTKNMATGAYIIKLNTATGVISKKVLVQKN